MGWGGQEPARGAGLLWESVENAQLSWRQSAEESSGFIMTASVGLIPEGLNHPCKVFCFFKVKKKWHPHFNTSTLDFCLVSHYILNKWVSYFAFAFWLPELLNQVQYT